jgi:hypothetical protein
MKLINTIVVACAFGAVSAYAADPVLSDTTCEQLGEKYEVTAEALERFADLKGACDGVYEVDGSLYVRVGAIVRRVVGSRVQLYVPATDHTFMVTAEEDGRVWVGSRKMRIRNLSSGDEIGIYLSVDKFAEEKVDEIAFVTPEEHPEPIVIAPVEEVEALPTTG